MATNNKTQVSILGRSLLLVSGDLFFSGGDFATVADRANFLQGLEVMIETPFATDVFNVNYGFDILNILSSAQTLRLTKELIRLNIVKSVSQDDRVHEVKEVVFDDEPRFFQLDPGSDVGESLATHRASRVWRAVVVLETAAEGEVALQLQGAGL